MVDKGRSLPVYEQVAVALKRDIASGELSPGDQLPSYQALHERFGVSVTTAQRALRLLKDEGLIEGRVGEGTFVRQKRQLFAHSSSYVAPTESGKWAWGEEAAAQGMTGTQRMREVREVPAPEEVADRLNVTTGDPVVLRARVMLLDGDPVELVDSYYPIDIARDTPLAKQGRLKGGSPAALVAAGHGAVEYDEKVKGGPARLEEARALGVPVGTTVLRLARTLFDADGRAVEACFMVLNAERIELSYRLPVHG